MVEPVGNIEKLFRDDLEDHFFRGHGRVRSEVQSRRLRDELIGARSRLDEPDLGAGLSGEGGVAQRLGARAGKRRGLNRGDGHERRIALVDLDDGEGLSPAATRIVSQSTIFSDPGTGLNSRSTSAIVADCVARVKQERRWIPTEASGGIVLENIRDYAETGVEFISVGALTHSATAADISMRITAEGR